MSGDLHKPQIDAASFDAGIADGACGYPMAATAENAFSYMSGYIEGKAWRGGYEVAVDVARVAERATRHAVDPGAAVAEPEAGL